MKTYIYASRYLLNKGNDSITKYMTVLHVTRAHLVLRGVCLHLKQNQFNRVFPKCFHWICWIFVITVKELEPATSCIRDQDVATAPARHMWKTGSLNWAQFMLQWFIRFLEFAQLSEFNESSVPFRKNSNTLGIHKRSTPSSTVMEKMPLLHPYVSLQLFDALAQR